MPGTSLRLPTCTQLSSATFGMSWSGQTMTCMPFASVTACTWSAPGTCAGADGAAHVQDIAAASNALASNPRDMAHPRDG